MYQFARYLTRTSPRILMYHRFSKEPRPGFVSEKSFRKQLIYINKYYRPTNLNELSHLLFEGKRVPENTLVITVDDGYRDFHDVAWPLLEEYNIPATLFVTTGFVEGDLWLWPDQVTWLCKNAPNHDIVFETRGLYVSSEDVHRDYAGVWKRLIGHLLSIPDPEKHNFIRSLASAWKLVLPRQAPVEFQACSWAQLGQMEASGIEIGGHTITHPSLGRVDSVQASHEIVGCRDALDEKLGSRARPFCYPNGEPSDFNPALKAVVEQAGFTCAVTAFADSLEMQDRYALRRHSGSDEPFQFFKSVSGVELMGHRLRKTIRVKA
ncbi:polysaccharide deacetylase family protein [Marinobacter sp. V034]|uniref:polysaccharide deacetylase family protein n=1 Tax=Marinobacter sp. V034 TaxID=3459610 RepID=UPI0040442ED8